MAPAKAIIDPAGFLVVAAGLTRDRIHLSASARVVIDRQLGYLLLTA